MDPVYFEKVPLVLACMSEDMDELISMKLQGDRSAAHWKARRMASEILLELDSLDMDMTFDEYLVMNVVEALANYHVCSIQFSRFEGPPPPCCEPMRSGGVHAPGCPQSRNRRR